MTAPLTEPTSDTIAPGRKRRRDGAADRLVGADWRAEDDAIGAAHGAGADRR